MGGMTPNASWGVQVGIAGLALVALASVGLLLRRTSEARQARWYWVWVLAWLTYSGLLGASGFLAQFEGMPPRFLLLLLPTLGLPVALAVSKVGRALTCTAPIAFLVLLQAFRLPLELVMHQAA